MRLIVALLIAVTLVGAQFSCSSDCGPICTLTGNVLIEGPSDTPMNTTSINDIFTGFRPMMSSASLCNSLGFEVRTWSDAQGWIWIPGGQLGIASVNNESIYGSPVLDGVGANLCVLKHRFQMNNIGEVRAALEGKQFRLRFPTQTSGQTCTTTFQAEGCPFSTNRNAGSSGPTWQWTQLALEEDIVEFYQQSVPKLAGTGAKALTISLVNARQQVSTVEYQADRGNYLIFNYNQPGYFNPGGNATVRIEGTDLTDAGGFVRFTVRGPPISGSQYQDPPLLDACVSCYLSPEQPCCDTYDESLSGFGVYVAKQRFDFGSTGFALGPINGPDMNPSTVSTSSSCFTITVSDINNIDVIRFLSFDSSIASNLDPLTGYTIASETAINNGGSYTFQVCMCSTGVYVSSSCKTSCPIRCDLTGPVFVDASNKDELMMTTCGTDAVYSHDEMAIDCNAVRYEAEIFNGGQYEWLSGDLLTHIKDRGQLDIYSACFDRSNTSCGLFQRFQDPQTARDVLGGRDVRVIVDRRRCFVEFHVAGCRSSFVGTEPVPTLVAPTPSPFPNVNGYLSSFDDFVNTLDWSVPIANARGVAIYFAKFADAYSEPGTEQNFLVVQVGKQDAADSSVSSVDVRLSSPDLLMSRLSPISNNAVLNFPPTNGQIAGTISTVNSDPTTGLAITVPEGGCVTVWIANYTNINQITIGSFNSDLNDVRKSFAINSTTMMTGQAFQFDLCICGPRGGDIATCPTLLPFVTHHGSSDSFIEEAVKSLPVQIMLGTLGTLVAVAAGVGLWTLVRKNARSLNRVNAEYSKL